MSALTPAADTIAAEWIIEAMQTFSESPLSLVPRGLSCYVRVFHPAYKVDRRAPDPWSARVPVRWSEIAAAKGTQAHPAMQLPAIAQTWQALNQPLEGVFDSAPALGKLSKEMAAVLASLLAKHTAAPERCWFAVWAGFGGTRDDIRSAPEFKVPARQYFLLRGAIGAINESVTTDPRWQTANIWWPDDHAWCVATEIDLHDTYIACGEACRAELLASPELEALDIDPTVGVTWRTDTINPLPDT